MDLGLRCSTHLGGMFISAYISRNGKVYHFLCFSALKEEVGRMSATNFSYGGCNAWDKLKCLWLCGFED